MTVGGVSVPAWPWAWAVLFLALYGLLDLCHWAAGVLGRLGRWLVRDRVAAVLEDDGCPVCGRLHFPWCDDEESLPPLPPERTWKQIIHRQYPLAEPPDPTPSVTPAMGRGSAWSASFGAERERRPPAYESEARAHYVAMGLDYPSGLMARVRELTP